MLEGREVATDEDEPRTGTGNHAPGEASRSGLRHFAVSCSADEPKIDLFTCPDLHDCHLIGNEEERRFLADLHAKRGLQSPTHFKLSPLIGSRAILVGLSFLLNRPRLRGTFIFIK